MSEIGQFPEQVRILEVIPGEPFEVFGNLDQGRPMKDLSWAYRSSNACWPATQNKKFKGAHVLYSFQIPPFSEVKIKLTPGEESANFSLYGYQVGTSNYSVPPDLASCITCEADHKWDRPKVGQSQDHTRSIFFNSIKYPYNIVVGVVGGEGQTEGAFKLKVKLKSRKVETEVQESIQAFAVQGEKGKTLAYEGDLAQGVLVHDLSWASNSSVACFPATQNEKFTGKHVFFVTEIPPYSIMDIRLIPEDTQANFSLYAYQDGTSSNAFPPALHRCVSCQADHKWDYPKKGKTQDHSRCVSLNAVRNPYRVVIGVVGADGLSEGKFRLEIKME